MADITYQPNSLIDLDMSKVGTSAPPDATGQGLADPKAGYNTLVDAGIGMREGFKALGKGETWRDIFTFRFGDIVERETGQERIRRTNELKRLEADRQAEEALARKRKMNLAAGLALMQNANMVNFFR